MKIKTNKMEFWSYLQLFYIKKSDLNKKEKKEMDKKKLLEKFDKLVKKTGMSKNDILKILKG